MKRRHVVLWSTQPLLLRAIAGIVPTVLITSGCGSRPPARPTQPPHPAPTPPRSPVPDSRRDGEAMAPAHAQAVAVHALGLVGTPYRYGGNTPESGFDCSGLIGYVYWHAAGLRAPRTVRQIVTWGQPITQGSLQTGDLLVFGQRSQADHAAIYVGDGRFVHAPSTGGTVRLERLDARYWAARWLGTRRVSG